MFPEAYEDRNASPWQWKKNPQRYMGVINGIARKEGIYAAAVGENPWKKIMKLYGPGSFEHLHKTTISYENGDVITNGDDIQLIKAFFKKN